MRIVVCSQYFWPENFRINDLVKGLASKGLHVDVLTGQPNYPQGTTYDGYRWWRFFHTVWEGITIYRLPLAPRGSGSALRLIVNYLSFVMSGIVLAPFALRRKRVDVVFVYAISPILQAIPAIVLKWTKGAKVVVWVQDLWPESLEATGFVRNPLLLKMTRCLVRWIYHQADLILVQSEAFIQPVAMLADRSKIYYYPNSADEIFSSANGCRADAESEAEEGSFSVVFAGNLGTAQSVDTIVEAATLLKETPEIRIFLVGDGSRAQWIRDQVQQRGLANVVMMGRHPLDAMPAILGRADALLVTLRDEPIFCHTVPSKIQAYLAIGRPIIASLNGEGARVIADADAGISCPAGDGRALAEAIKHVSKLSATERKRHGENGRRYFETHYDSEMLTQRLISHFESVIGERDSTIN